MTNEHRASGPLTEVHERWRRDGILYGQGASEADLVSFERRHGVVLPTDLRAYFAATNGTTVGAYGMEDGDLLGFWHLDQVRTFAEGGVVGTEAHRSFVFADHSIWVYAFAIQLSSDPAAATPVVVDIGQPFHRVAASFTEFVERYLAGDEATLYPDPPRPSVGH